jgi:hypothetical protein
MRVLVDFCLVLVSFLPHLNNVIMLYVGACERNFTWNRNKNLFFFSTCNLHMLRMFNFIIINMAYVFGPSVNLLPK